MGVRFLKPVYSFVYGEDFNPGNPGVRIKMQNAVYLLQELGIRIGDYDFLWYKCGLRSQALQSDIEKVSDIPAGRIKYTDEARGILEELKTLVTGGSQYTILDWTECLASLQYLRSSVFGRRSKETDIIDELQKRKPHLHNGPENRRAVRMLKRYIR